MKSLKYNLHMQCNVFQISQITTLKILMYTNVRVAHLNTLYIVSSSTRTN